MMIQAANVLERRSFGARLGLLHSGHGGLKNLNNTQVSEEMNPLLAFTPCPGACFLPVPVVCTGVTRDGPTANITTIPPR